jgi:hypothetical protein
VSVSRRMSGRRKSIETVRISYSRPMRDVSGAGREYLGRGVGSSGNGCGNLTTLSFIPGQFFQKLFPCGYYLYVHDQQYITDKASTYWYAYKERWASR